MTSTSPAPMAWSSAAVAAALATAGCMPGCNRSGREHQGEPEARGSTNTAAGSDTRPSSAARPGHPAPALPARLDRLPTLAVPRLAPGKRVVIDGRLEDDAWSRAGRLDITHQAQSGQTMPPGGARGSLRLLWDAAAMYLAFEVADPDVLGGFPEGAVDPKLWTRDTVEVMVDPDGDGDSRDYYELQINPQNLVFDSLFDDYNQPRVAPNGPFGHQDWSSRVESAVTIAGTMDDALPDEGYRVELRLPWASFVRAKRSPPHVGDVWRMNFYVMESNGGASWSPLLGRGNFHRASRFGRVIWSE